MESNTHYRKVFKSDHLGSADLEEMQENGKRPVFTIDKVEQYNLVVGDKESGVSVAGKRISANIAYFKNGVKPLVLNATNSKTMAKMTSSKFVEDWAGFVIELYIDPNVKMKGEMVGGVRIKPRQAEIQKPKLTPDNKNWGKAKEAVKTGEADIDSIRENWDITQENFDLLCG